MKLKPNFFVFGDHLCQMYFLASSTKIPGRIHNTITTPAIDQSRMVVEGYCNILAQVFDPCDMLPNTNLRYGKQHHQCKTPNPIPCSHFDHLVHNLPISRPCQDWSKPPLQKLFPYRAEEGDGNLLEMKC